MTEALTAFVVAWSEKIPLTWFAFVGSLVEEIVAPIPSPLVMTLSGTAALAQEVNVGLFVWVAFLSGAGKTLGSWVVYWVADKTEDMLVPRFGRYIGIRHADVESWGEKLSGSWRDILALLVVRTVPIVPSVVVSAACGALRYPLTPFLLTALLGSFLRALLFMYAGYTGLASLHALIDGVEDLASVLKLALGAVVICVLGWVYLRRLRGSTVQ